MNRRYMVAAMAAFSIAGSWPAPSLATRVYGDLVTGEVTATGTSFIEVERRRYPIKGKSAAALAILKIHTGEVVDLVLEGPASDTKSEVLSIVQHSR